MRKIGTLLFILVFISSVSALQVEMQEDLQKGETLIAKISGNIDPILEENIFFYRDSYIDVPFEFELLKIQQETYLYAPTTEKISGNYSLVLEGIEYYIEGGQSSEDVVKNFSISENYAPFSTLPGVSKTQGNLDLEFENLKAEEISISFEQNSVEEEQGSFWDFLTGGDSNKSFSGEEIITLNPGETKKITIGVESTTNKTMKELQFHSEGFTQTVLAYVLFQNQDQEVPENTSKIEFNESSLEIKVPINESFQKILELENSGSLNIENVSISLSDSLNGSANIMPDLIENFESGDIKEISLEIFLEEDDSISGAIIAETSEDYYAHVNLEIIPVSNESLLNETEDTNNSEDDVPAIKKTCKEAGGAICEEDLKCDGEEIMTKEGECCIGVCSEKEESSSGRTIGIIIIALLIIIYTWFYFKKYKKVKKKPNILKSSKTKKKK